MRKGLTELVFILDRSGSMSGLESDTTGGFNSMIERQKKEKGEAYVSTVLFDDVSEVIHDRVNIADVRELSDRDYYVRGCTALLDAVGRAVHHIETVHRYARSEDVPEKTVFVITTDGLENASREYTYDKVRTMISKKRKWDGILCSWVQTSMQWVRLPKWVFQLTGQSDMNVILKVLQSTSPPFPAP